MIAKVQNLLPLLEEQFNQFNVYNSKKKRHKIKIWQKIIALLSK